jgi:fatty acid desaturase
MSEAIVEGAACRPNFSGAGRRRRLAIARAAFVITGVAFAAFIVLGAGWPVRLLLALPAMLGFVTYLQVTRNTCVAHAGTGTFEHEDFSVTKVDAALAEASRKVAKTIVRDGVLLGAFVTLSSVATAFI